MLIVSRSSLIKKEEEVKRNRLLVIFGIVGLSLTLVVLPMVACAKPAPAPAPTPTPMPTPTPTPAPAPETPAEFYGKNRVTIIVAAGVGGGNDYVGRIFASFWPGYVPGGTTVVKNMSPPVGILGLNYLSEVKPDGLTLAVTESGSGLLSPVLLKDTAVKYDAAKFLYIGGIGYCPAYLMVSKKLPYNSVQDLVGASGLRFGATGARGDGAIAAAVVTDLLGIQGAKIVPGYESTAEMGLAMGRGEIDAAIESASRMQDWMDKGYGKPPFAVAFSQRSAWFPNVPAITEIVKPSPKQEANMKVVEAMASIKVLLTAPGVPQDKVQFQREVFTKIVADKGFLKLAQMLFSVWEKPISGEDYAKRVTSTLAISPEDVTGIIQMIEKMTKL